MNGTDGTGANGARSLGNRPVKKTSGIAQTKKLQVESEMQNRINPNGPMKAATIAALRSLVEEIGDHGAAAKAVGISVSTLARALSGMPVAPSVRFMVEAKLRERAAGAA